MGKDLLENLERQVDEVESLQAIYGTDEVVDGGVRIEVSGLDVARGILESGGLQEGAITLLVTFGEADLLQLSGVRVRLPAAYPSDASPVVDLGSKFLTTRCGSELVELAAESLGSECLFQLLQSIVSAVEEGAREVREEEEQAKEEEEDLKRHLEAKLAEGRRAQTKTVLGRRMCFSHHIIAQSKRSAVIQWALELKLGGCSKIGWPGLVCVEGDERHCQIYISMLQRLRWKKFVVRGEEQVEAGDGETLDSLRRLPAGFCEFQQDEMHLFAGTLKDAGLEDLFRTSMK
ncbi:hypothetical protein HOP50_04g33560 [Chloropicon primus]|uniref:RWD domain-containing protein n=1 Tax=Chloropicon primus TaxID=1764295 RepID=A0A5B8MME8_9CHLO|nr:hypothetical protein A3770_04p33530 [Chloropicon primus]UPR00047.1 hypothetical protein HOP50_04g33560 [Chloropicon primus]|mmetsp:Transcript_4698/g.14026  ORF Transcript_4698/g.14026 Transcript_4698/m.14026 type:complete len:290 (-) Transcript_4698:2622-3491(-)|eukprot:QDZ20835.1 hypothetical protein A3770_04p33530 [Chloropicon primus]